MGVGGCYQLLESCVRKKSYRGTFSFSNCHIIGLDTGSLVLNVYAQTIIP
jgi:hypothetical protein